MAPSHTRRQPIRKLLIANRGEIACRIIRTCRARGVGTVAVYSVADQDALHRHLADQSFPLRGSEARESYLDQSAIIAAAQESGCDAVHPGYGFLSENASFAEALTRANITFVGPSARAMRLLGDKLGAKELARRAAVPLLPSLEVRPSSRDKITAELKAFAKKTGFPLIIKAAGGGGGRGMRKVLRQEDLAPALASAAREAESFFNDGRVFVEKFIEKARHVEVQVFGDLHGNVIHLYDRDCSWQRSHQKVIEEAPAPQIPSNVRRALHDAACRIVKRARYSGAATVEFLYTPNNDFFLLEVNSRLQVEHPVTEAITGLDLVGLQLDIAEGRDLAESPPPLAELTECGHAIELRLCAEDPQQQFRASTGSIEQWIFPQNPHVRVDTGFRSGDTISHYYDSLLAKIIVLGSTRAEAVLRAQQALAAITVTGIVTNTEFLANLLVAPTFHEARHHINEAISHLGTLDQREAQEAKSVIAATLTELLPPPRTNHGGQTGPQSRDEESPWQRTDRWRVSGRGSLVRSYRGEVGSWRVEITQGLKEQLRIIATLQDGTSSKKFEYGVSEGDLRAAHAHPTPAATTAGGTEIQFTLLRPLPQGGAARVDTATVPRKGERRVPTQFATTSREFLKATVYCSASGVWVRFPPFTHHVRPAQERLKEDASHAATCSLEVRSPLPGKIVAVRVKSGTTVEMGTPIVVLESMKMEHPITAPQSGKIAQVHVKEGDVVDAKALLLTFS